MAIKPSQMRATAKYHAKTYDRVEIKIRKDGKDGITLPELVEALGDKSKTEYILEAICEKNEREKKAH